MYLQYFGLLQQPFNLTPDTELLFQSASFQRAYNEAMLAIASGEGFIKITGEVGTGKSLLCRTLLNSLQKIGFATAFIHNPLLTPRETYELLADELGIELGGREGMPFHVKEITKKLLSLAAEGKPAVLLIDEAHCLPDATLEAIRLMTNLETEKSKILQVVLIGQTELDYRLQTQSNLRPLRHRITFSCMLQPITAKEVPRYLAHRLTAAGYTGKKTIFTDAVCRKLYRHSDGNPRVLNILAHKTLWLAFGKKQVTVTPALVELAVKDTEDGALLTNAHQEMGGWQRVEWILRMLLWFLVGGAMMGVTLLHFYSL
ncbi:MAG: AAA family ATPase [Magnetococcus sp. YQC-5]